jgi:hypothetical protein
MALAQTRQNFYLRAMIVEPTILIRSSAHGLDKILG